MATSYTAEGRVLPYVAGAAITSGDVLVISTLIGVAIDDIANGSTGPAQVAGVFTLTCLATDVVAQGDLLYWDAGNSRLTTTASTHVLAGKAYTASANGVATCAIMLNI